MSKICQNIVNKLNKNVKNETQKIINSPRKKCGYLIKKFEPILFSKKLQKAKFLLKKMITKVCQNSVKPTSLKSYTNLSKSVNKKRSKICQKLSKKFPKNVKIFKKCAKNCFENLFFRKTTKDNYLVFKNRAVIFWKIIYILRPKQ